MSVMPHYLPAELRVDPADGNAYDFQSFINCYGNLDGLVRWMAAKPLVAPAFPAPPAPPAPPPPPASLVAHAGLLDAITNGATKIVQEKVAEKLAKKVVIEAEVKKLDEDIKIAGSQWTVSEEKSVILNDVTAVVQKEQSDLLEYLTTQAGKRTTLKDQLNSYEQVGWETKKRKLDEPKQQVDTGDAAGPLSILWEATMKIARNFTSSKK